MSDWAVGDLAVCVDDSPDPFAGHNGGLALGKTYTVKEVVHTSDDVGLRLVDLPDPPDCVYRAFIHTRFRKIRPDAHEGNAEDWRDILKLNTRTVSA